MFWPAGKLLWRIVHHRKLCRAVLRPAVLGSCLRRKGHRGRHKDMLGDRWGIAGGRERGLESYLVT
jgi:hypothetical protein